MSRLLVLRRITQSLRTSNRGIHPKDTNHGTTIKSGFHISKYKTYSHRGFASIKNTFSRNYSIIPSNKTITHHTQIARKTLSKNATRNSQAINKTAQAFTLALTRSYIVLPGIFALTYGNIALADSGSNIGYLNPRNTLNTHAEKNRHACLIASVFEGLILVFRAIYLAILFSPTMLMAPFADRLGPTCRKKWVKTVRRTLEMAGPAFIKWGQWAATRPDLFPTDLCKELSKLHRKAPEHTFAYTKKTVEKAFGRKINEIFDDFEEVPIASGSIAQIHRASLQYKYNKRTKPLLVAVKVRHPGVGESIRRDFEIINVVAKMSKFIPTLNWLRLDEIVQQFAVCMMSQVDLAREAAHLSRFRYNFRRWRNVSFPKPVYPLVHPAVLVETFEHGETVSRFVDELGEGHVRLKSSLAHIGTHALLKMLLVDNFIHADMHPGNILVRPRKGMFKSKAHVIFLDVGMTAELSKSERINLLKFFKAVARRDGRTAAEYTLRLSKQQNCPNPHAFIKEVTESFNLWGTPEGDIIHPADCMYHVLEQVRRHRVNVDGNVCTVIMVTALALGGWQRELDPDDDVMHTLQTSLLKDDWATSPTYTIESLI